MINLHNSEPCVDVEVVSEYFLLDHPDILLAFRSDIGELCVVVVAKLPISSKIYEQLSITISTLTSPSLQAKQNIITCQYPSWLNNGGEFEFLSV